MATGPGGGSTAATLSFRQMIALAVKAGFSVTQAATVAAIGMAESGGRTSVTSPNPDGGTNIGWLQIDSTNAPDANLSDPLASAREAKKLHDAAHGFGDWATYAGGQYSLYLPAAQAAAANLHADAGSAPGGLGGLVDKIISDIGGIGTDIGKGIKGLAGQVLSLPQPVTDFFDSAEQLLHAGLWLLNPANWMRILAGFAGVLLALAGLYVLAKAA